MKKVNLIEGNIAGGIIIFVIPIILGSLIQQLYITIDSAIVGQFVGKPGLAAIDSVYTLFKFPLNFMNGLSAGATIVLSKYYGVGDKASIKGAVKSSIFMSVLLGVVCSALGVVFAPRLLNIMAVPSEIYSMTLIYTRIYFGGICSMVVYNISAGILRSQGDSKRPLFVLIICSIVNILLDVLLVGVIKMGVFGAAIATVFAQSISAFIMLIFIFGDKQEVPAKGRYLKNIVRTGFPLALQSMLFPIANSLVQASVNSMGTDCIAAWGICDKLSMLIWLISDSMSPAISTYVAQNTGAGKCDRSKKGSIIGCGISVVTVWGVCLVLYIGKAFFASWFINSSELNVLLPLIIKYMNMMLPFYFFYSIAEAFSGACCGMGKTMSSMIVTMSSICLTRVIAIMFIFPNFNSMECIIWIYVVSWIIAGVAFFSLFLTVHSRVNK